MKYQDHGMDESALRYIIKEYLNHTLTIDQLQDPKIKPLIEALRGYFADEADSLAITYMASIMKMADENISMAFEIDEHLKIVFEAIKDTEFVKDLLASATVVHCEYNPQTGETRPVTLH